jgi:hypothetical protein
MKRSNQRYIVFAAGAAIAALTYALSLPRQKYTDLSVAVETQLQPSRARSIQALAEQPRVEPTVSRVDRAIDSSGESSERSEAGVHDNRGEPETALSRARSAVRQADPHIAEYERLRGKALPTFEEQSQLRAMLKDPEMIESAKRDLTATESAVSEEAQYRRMSRVELLDAALEWGDNPAREAILLAVEEVILTPNVVEAQPLELQRSLAGDKVELYMSLLDRDPELAESIAEKAKDTPFERLIEYARVRHKAAKSYGQEGG